jgi:hypothetical protein
VLCIVALSVEWHNVKASTTLEAISKPEDARLDVARHAKALQQAAVAVTLGRIGLINRSLSCQLRLGPFV